MVSQWWESVVQATSAGVEGNIYQWFWGRLKVASEGSDEGMEVESGVVISDREICGTNGDWGWEGDEIKQIEDVALDVQ